MSCEDPTSRSVAPCLRELSTHGVELLRFNRVTYMRTISGANICSTLCPLSTPRERALRAASYF